MLSSRRVTGWVPVAIALVVVLRAREGCAEELHLSARSLALGGTFVGAKDDPAAPLLNPAAMAASSLHLGGSLGYASLDSRGSGVAGFPRGSLAYRRGSFAFGGGLGPRSYEGRGFSDATEYEASIAFGVTLIEDPTGGRLAVGVAYRPRLVFLTVGDFEGVAGTALGAALGATYSPFDELSFGMAFESGGVSEGSLVDGTSAASNRLRAPASVFSPPTAALGVEFELDRWTARLDYRLELASLRPRVELEAATYDAGAPPGATPPGETRLGARFAGHSVALGFEHRLPVGRAELPVRFGLGLLTANEGPVLDDWTTRAGPRGLASAGLGYRAREHELAFGVRLSTTLGDAGSAASSFLAALDWTYRFDR